MAEPPVPINGGLHKPSCPVRDYPEKPQYGLRWHFLHAGPGTSRRPDAALASASPSHIWPEGWGQCLDLGPALGSRWEQDRTRGTQKSQCGSPPVPSLCLVCGAVAAAVCVPAMGLLFCLPACRIPPQGRAPLPKRVWEMEQAVLAARGRLMTAGRWVWAAPLWTLDLSVSASSSGVSVSSPKACSPHTATGKSLGGPS